MWIFVIPILIQLTFVDVVPKMRQLLNFHRWSRENMCALRFESNE